LIDSIDWGLDFENDFEIVFWSVTRPTFSNSAVQVFPFSVEKRKTALEAYYFVEIVLTDTCIKKPRQEPRQKPSDSDSVP
jgi:hypothetical protein